MTNLDDFDRSLAGFLADGPTIAPEAPVVAALAHARTTPRRPDPLARFRPDVMTRPRTGVAVVRPALVFATVAILVAAVGIAVIGSRPAEVLPAPSDSPAPSVTPSVARSASPSPSVPPSIAQIVLRGTAGDRATMDVVDRSGHLLAASKLDLGESESFEALTATNLDDRTVKIGWPGSPCDTVHLLTIGPDLGITIDRPKCLGDAVPAFYAVRLGFDQPVDATTLGLSLLDARPESGLPTWTATGIAADDGLYQLQVYDASGRLVLPEPRSDAASPPDPGAVGYTLERISDADARLIWRAPACATSQTLRIDPSALTWELSWNACTPTESTTLRVLDLRFDHLPDTTGITVNISGPES